MGEMEMPKVSENRSNGTNKNALQVPDSAKLGQVKLDTEILQAGKMTRNWVKV